MSEATKQKRRGKGEGTIIFRDGKWIGVISVGLDSNGKRIRRWVRGDTRKAVQDEMTVLRGQALDGTLIGNTRTKVTEWLKHWIENIAPHDKKPCRPTTLAGYEKIVRLYIDPVVGGLALSKLKPANIEAMHGALRKSGKGAGTIRIAHSILRRALNAAIDRGILTVNPCLRATAPGLVKAEMRSLTTEEAAAFLKAAKADRLNALFVVALTTGLRQGELFGLKRDDIDLESGTLTVRRTLVDTKKGFLENPPKSASGSRTVALSAMAIEALTDHFRRMMAEGNAGARYVFCDIDGGALRRSNVRRRSLRSILQAAGLPEMRFHDLRHSSATLLLASGENPKVIQQRLGHSHVSITLGTYSHVLPGMDQAAAAKFDTMLRDGTAG